MPESHDEDWFFDLFDPEDAGDPEPPTPYIDDPQPYIDDLAAFLRNPRAEL